MVRLFLIFLISCNFNTLSPKQIRELSLKYDPEWREVIPENMETYVHCSDYGPGCVSVKEAFTSNITFIMVQFKNEEQACKNAAVLGEYCLKNWLFDEVVDEPILERFVEEAFGAIRP